jgi:outer membrane receptor for ferric coprogen and ferric-rhodotorulic acid
MATRIARLLGMSALLGTTMLTGLGLAGPGVSSGLAQERADATQLPTIVIEGSSYETEGTGSYTTDLISVGEKDVRPLKEIPQSTTVLTRERLQDANYTSLDTAMRETPGIVVLNNDDGRSSIFSRGFEFDTLYFNGLPAPLSSIYGTQPDMAIVDHVEVLRGPAGLFGGTGEPAGAINMRLKQAPDNFEARFTASGGSWNNRRAEIDVGSPLNKAGTIRGRFVGALQAKDNFVDVSDARVGVGYGTIQADIAENTTATFSISHMERDITPFNGLPTLADGTLLDIDRSTYTGADWNNFDNSVTDYIVELEHKFEDGGHAKVSGRYSDRSANFLYGWAGTAADANGNVGSMSWLGQDFSETSLSLDAHVSKPFELWGQEQNVIVGADYRHVNTTSLRGTGRITGPFNIYDWNSDVPEPTVNYTQQTKTDPTQFGIYGQLRIKPVDRLTLIGGGRLSWYDATTTNLTTGANQSEVDIDAETTPYAGIVYDLTDWLSAYGSYTQIFQPQTDLDADGNMLKPREGRQFEAGLKADLFNSGMNGSIAYFNLRDENRATANPNVPGASVALGKVEAQGIEIEASGEILPNWQLAGGYTYTKTKYLNTAQQGDVFSTYTPEHMFQLWTKYTFDENAGALKGFYVGGGLKAFSSFSSVAQGVTVRAPGYTVVDLLAGYKFNDHLDASLTINNVFDEKYYARVGSASVFNFYGEPLSATFKISSTF